MNIFGFQVPQLPVWVLVGVVYVMWVLALTSVKVVLFEVLRKLAEKTKNKFDDIFIQALNIPLHLIILASGVLVVQTLMPMAMQDEKMSHVLVPGFKAILILAAALFIDKITIGLMRQFAKRIEFLRTSGAVVTGMARVVVIGLGAMIVLDTMGISITPIIASLGIGSLAVALALQPTLENFFSGVQLVMDRPIREGQFIKLESGEEGYVHKIGWRSTWIRMLPNNMVIIPNKSLTNSRLTNYYYPDTDMAVLIQVGVHYMSDLEKVEKVTIDVGREVMQTIKGGIKDFEPFIRFHTFDSSSINFSVILRTNEFVGNYLIKHEFIKRLQKRYLEEGITIPYPIRAINYDQEKQFEEKSKN